MPYESVNYEPVYRLSYFAAIGLAIASIAIFQLSDKPDPANSRAYGCYVSDAAPAILLDQTGMTILQPGFSRILYHLERHKTAITLVADAPIQANRSGNRYIYSFYHPGVGEFLDFHHVIDGHQYGQFDETQLSSFSMLANDYVELTYNKAPRGKCQPVGQSRSRPLSSYLQAFALRGTVQCVGVGRPPGGIVRSCLGSHG